MSLMDSYLLKTSNLGEFFSSIQAAQAPEKFTQKFLKDLGFDSSNDRLLLRVLKGLGFVEDTGVPTQTYFDFLDQSQSQKVLAQKIKEAYSELFALNSKAYEMPEAEIKNKLKTLTQGKKSENVIANMTRTFKVLCEQADFSAITKPKKTPAAIATAPPQVPNKEQAEVPLQNKPNLAQLHYNIQIHLPESRDPKVYDAIFESLNKHLL